MVRHWLRLGLVILVVLVVQATVISDMEISGATGEIPMLVAVAAALSGGAERGATVGFFSGLAFDLILVTPFGLAALTYTLLGFAVGSIRDRVHVDGPRRRLLFGAAASAAGIVAFALLGAVVGDDDLLTARLGVTTAVVAAIGGPALLLIAPTVDWAMPPVRKVLRSGSVR